MSFPTKQLYLTNPSPKPTESPLNNSHTQNPYTPSMHPPNTYHPHPRTSTKPNQQCHIISNEPVTIPPRANTMNHPLCPSAFQNLNKATIKDSYLLPQDTLDTLYCKNLFMTLDLLKGQSSCKKRPFTTRVRLFQYIGLPFGVTNASASFQR